MILTKGGALKTTSVTPDHTHSAADDDGGNTLDLDGTGELILDADADTKIYSSTDDTPKLDIAGVTLDLGRQVSGITRTVGSGKDHATIQEAIDWFKDKTINGATCTIDVDPGTYSENIDISYQNNPNATLLKIQGDTRDLAGMSWIDGSQSNTNGIANGGSGTVTLANAGNNITVTMSTTNPNFNADGWGDGDYIYVRTNTGGYASYYVSSTSANVITLNTTAPAMGTDGTSITLIPNTRIGTGGGTALSCYYSKAEIDGFWVYGAGLGVGAAALVSSGAKAIFRNCMFSHSYYGLLVSNTAYVQATSNNTAYYNTIGYFVYAHAALTASYSSAIGASGTSHGFYADRMGALECYKAQAGGHSGTHFYATNGSYMYAVNAFARNNGVGIGFRGYGNGTCFAATTNAYVNCATNYSPAPGVGAWAEAAGDFGVVYRS